MTASAAGHVLGRVRKIEGIRLNGADGHLLPVMTVWFPLQRSVLQIVHPIARNESNLERKTGIMPQCRNLERLASPLNRFNDRRVGARLQSCRLIGFLNPRYAVANDALEQSHG
jgi:hypothetical protein